MAQGRGKANVVMISAMFVVMLMIQTDMVNAATTHTVGGVRGWGFGVASWAKGKRFKTGDVLVFQYKKGVHDVVKVDEKSYNSCNTPGGARVLKTGNDQIRLVKGQNFFLCSNIAHCESGMKIVVHAA